MRGVRARVLHYDGVIQLDHRHATGSSYQGVAKFLPSTSIPALPGATQILFCEQWVAQVPVTEVLVSLVHDTCNRAAANVLKNHHIEYGVTKYHRHICSLFDTVFNQPQRVKLCPKSVLFDFFVYLNLMSHIRYKILNVSYD